MIKNFKQFESNNTCEKVIEEIYNKIDDIGELIDKQIPEYLDDDWEDEFESEYDAYMEQGRGEAESSVISSLVKDWESENFKLEPNDYICVIEGLSEKYGVSI